jgi:hypothetical protein
VLYQELGSVDALRAKRPKQPPAVLTKDETLCLISCLSGTHQLMLKLIYDSGVRLMECLRLRVKDLESDRRALTVRDGKGAQDRVAVGLAEYSRPSQPALGFRYSDNQSEGLFILTGESSNGCAFPARTPEQILQCGGGVSRPSQVIRHTSDWVDKEKLGVDPFGRKPMDP